MRMRLFIALAACLFSPLLLADNGLINVKSTHDVATTADRLEAVLKAKGMNIFARIDHAKGAKSVGNDLRPTQLVIFGNPKIGSVLMGCGQSTGVDLPQKALIWEDQNKNVWLTYNDPGYLMQRHDIDDCKEAVAKVSGALGKFAAKATSAE